MPRTSNDRQDGKCACSKVAGFGLHMTGMAKNSPRHTTLNGTVSLVPNFVAVGVVCWMGSRETKTSSTKSSTSKDFRCNIFPTWFLHKCYIVYMYIYTYTYIHGGPSTAKPQIAPFLAPKTKVSTVVCCTRDANAAAQLLVQMPNPENAQGSGKDAAIVSKMFVSRL